MRSLKNKPQVNAPSSTYPYGQIKDDDGSGSVGTPLNEQVYGDFHQFFSQLMTDGGLTANEIAENEYDGFQLNTALGNFIKKLAELLIDNAKPTLVWNVITLINGWVKEPGTPDPAYMVDFYGRVFFRGLLRSAGASSSTFTNSGAAPNPYTGTASPGGVLLPSINVLSGAYSAIYINPTGTMSIGFGYSTTVGTSYDLHAINYPTK